MKDFTFVQLGDAIPPGSYQVLFVPNGWIAPVSGTGAPFVHIQTIASADWVIPHSFTYVPVVYAVDNNGDVFYPDIVHTNLNTVVHLYHFSPQTGKAYLK